MFDERDLESAEFYKRRYSSYSTIIITPLFLMVVILIVFSIFGKREITIESPGQITPKKTLSLIQSTSNNKIDKINIHENQFVKKGEKLIQYKSSDGEITNKLLDLQITNVNNKITALNTFENSVLAGKNLFSKPDNFGYMNLYNNFLHQINDMNAGLQQTNADRINDDNQAKNQVNTLGNSKKDLDNQIEKIQDIIKAIQSDKKVDESNKYKYLLDNYNSQNSTLNSDEKNKLKQDTVTELNTQINSIKDNKTSIDQQIAGVKVENTVSPNQVNAQISQLKDKTIADIQDQRQSSELLIDQFKAKQSVQKLDDKDLVLTASNTGIIHLVTDLPAQEKIPNGTTIGMIYPKLEPKTALTVTFYLPSNKLPGVKIGQNIRYSVNQDLPKPMVINGKIIKIDTASTEMKTGNYFKIVASIPRQSKNSIKNIRYGSQGKVVVITGKKTWFNYAKDKLLDK